MLYGFDSSYFVRVGEDWSIGILVFGGVLFVVAALGMTASRCENRLLLGVYACVSLIVVILLLIFGGILLTKSGEEEDFVKDAWYSLTFGF